MGMVGMSSNQGVSQEPPTIAQAEGAVISSEVTGNTLFEFFKTLFANGFK